MTPSSASHASTMAAVGLPSGCDMRGSLAHDSPITVDRLAGSALSAGRGRAGRGRPRRRLGGCSSLDDIPRPYDRFPAPDDSAREICRPDASADLHIAANPLATGDHCPLADNGDTGVESARLLPVGRSVPAAAHDGAGADHDLFVEDCPVDDCALADDRVEHDDGVPDDGTYLDPDAGRQDAVHVCPVDHA